MALVLGFTGNPVESPRRTIFLLLGGTLSPKDLLMLWIRLLPACQPSSKPSGNRALHLFDESPSVACSYTPSAAATFKADAVLEDQILAFARVVARFVFNGHLRLHEEGGFGELVSLSSGILSRPFGKTLRDFERFFPTDLRTY